MHSVVSVCHYTFQDGGSCFIIGNRICCPTSFHHAPTMGASVLVCRDSGVSDTFTSEGAAFFYVWGVGWVCTHVHRLFPCRLSSSLVCFAGECHLPLVIVMLAVAYR